MDLMWLLLGALLLGCGLAYFLYAPKGDVRKVDASKQERSKASSAPSKQTAQKTAQLSALRERLDQAQSPGQARKPAPKAEASKPTPTAPKEKAWRPEDAGLVESEAASEVPRPTLAETLAASRPVEAPKVETVLAAEPMVFEQPLVQPPLQPTARQTLTPTKALDVVEAEPAAPVAEAPVGQAKQDLPPPAQPVDQPAQAPQILLVDDSKVVRVKTEKLLLSKGYAVTTAVDGIDALSKLETLKPHLIITDIEMPNLDGFGLVRNVRGNPRTEDIPVIVMTSHVNLHLDIAATEGINGFLPKPFMDQDLIDQVAFLCES